MISLLVSKSTNIQRDTWSSLQHVFFFFIFFSKFSVPLPFFSTWYSSQKPHITGNHLNRFKFQGPIAHQRQVQNQGNIQINLLNNLLKLIDQNWSYKSEGGGVKNEWNWYEFIRHEMSPTLTEEEFAWKEFAWRILIDDPQYKPSTPKSIYFCEHSLLLLYI